MAKKVIDIIPPRDRGTNNKPAVQKPPVEEAVLPELPISASEPLSRIQPQESLGSDEIKPEPGPQLKPLPDSEPLPRPELKPLVKPQVKPRITFMGQTESYGKDDDGGDDSFGAKLGGWFIKLLLLGAVVAAVMFAIDWKMAYAVVKIWPATSVLTDQTRITINPASQAVDLEKGMIPGLVLTVDDTIKAETEVTGKKDTQGKATGTVKIFNNYTAKQPLVKGTRLEADKSKFEPALTPDETPWFKTLDDLVLEPKSSATVSVIADKPGEKYNIEPSVFSVPGLAGTPQYTFIIAQSYEKFQGGSTGSAPSVTQADLDNAQKNIEELAKSEMEKKLLAQVPEGYVLVKETEKYEFGQANISAKLGDSLGKIVSDIGGKATAVAYRKADLDSIGKDFILSKVPQGSVAHQAKLAVNSAYEGPDPATGNTIMTVAAQVPVYPGMSDNDLKKGLSEKSAQEATLFLEDQGMRVEIKFTPVWRTSIPRDLDRIEVQTIIE